MTLNELLGIKKIKLKTTNVNSLDELLRKILTIDFGLSGSPELTHYGKKRFIVFPKIDSKNQVWIISDKNGGFYVKYSTTTVDTGRNINNYPRTDILREPRTICMADCTNIANAINALGL